MKGSQYWEKRIADKTWKTYNSLEEKNRAIFGMYKQASEDVASEVYKVGERLKTAAPSLSDMHKFNRLTQLKGNLDSIVSDMSKQVEQTATAAMQDGFRTVYSMSSEAMGVDFALPDKQLMDEMLNRPWLGNSFSNRLWGNAKQLERELNTSLLRGLQQGKTVTEMAIMLDNVMHKGFNAAHRLVRTESMHYMNQAARQSYIDAGVTHVRVWAAADERTCPECRKYHDRVYPIDKVPVLPFHANCRCTILPEIEENVFQNSAENGIISIGNNKNTGIDISIDALTPCLVNRATGKIVATTFATATSDDLKQLHGWAFDWDREREKGNTVYKLNVAGDDTIQGLVALQDQPENTAVYVSIAESAPWNREEDRQYEGVGGHLFAIAALKSVESGYGGFVFMDAKNPKLVRHYAETLGAQFVGTPHAYRMCIDEETARKLLDEYTLTGDD